MTLHHWSRREFVKRSLGWTALLCASRLPLRTARGQATNAAAPGFADLCPIDEAVDFSKAEVSERFSFARAFTGDFFPRAHEVFIDPVAFVAKELGGKLPEPTERVPLVIVGGGIAGLSTAFLLRQHKPIILEQAARFGGYAKGERWNDTTYAIGAAYFIKPDDGDEIDRFYQDIGIKGKWRQLEDSEPVEYRGKLFRKFWDGEAMPDVEAQFKAYRKHMHEYVENYPDIPIVDEAQRAMIDALDQRSLKEVVTEWLGGKVPEALKAAIQTYCHSSFGGGWQEISAAAGINFLAGEEFGVCVLPGGNAAIAQAILTKLVEASDLSRFRARSHVLDVRLASEGVRVSYVDRDNKAHCIAAKAAVMCGPKFVMKRIVNGMEPERISAIEELYYHPYLVVNVLLAAPLRDEFYDLFLLRDGAVYEQPPEGEEPPPHRATDCISGNWARHAQDASQSVLTLYWPLPFIAGRGLVLFRTDSREYLHPLIEQQTLEILGVLGIKPEAVQQIRLTRWGHPMPIAKVGFIKNGFADRIRKPMDDKIFFVHQDNWALPAIETSLTEAHHFAPQIEAALAR